MAAVALAETIKTNEEQPYGLEAACVDEAATASRKVYVDARFMEGTDLAKVPERMCVRQDYVIRFDPAHFEPSPAAGVVLLLVSAPTPKGREFNARIEEPNWPSKPPGTFASARCGSAFGVLRQSGSHWVAEVFAPARQPGELSHSHSRIP